MGEIKGEHWIALNPTRNDSNIGSFKINITNGKWADFATSDYGGDLISLYAYLNNISQIQAARKLKGEYYGE